MKTITRSSPQVYASPSIKFSKPVNVTLDADDDDDEEEEEDNRSISFKNRSRSSMRMMDLVDVWEMSSFKSESSLTFDKSTS